MSDVKPRLSIYGRQLLVERVLASRRSRKLGPAWIAGILELNPSTVHRVLVRNQLNRLAWMDRPTGTVIRRYEMSRPGELVHVDIKKLGRIRPGGGWRIHGRGSAEWKHSINQAMAGRHVRYAFVHSAIDAHSRLAYSEIAADENGPTAAAFIARAQAWFADHGVRIERVLTDNGSCYISKIWRDQLAAAQITHSRTRPYRPQTNGKSNASTARSSTNGPTCASTAPNAPANKP